MIAEYQLIKLVLSWYSGMVLIQGPVWHGFPRIEGRIEIKWWCVLSKGASGRQ
jgi:hypothetical protein